jgi:hypothetical protein
LSLSFPYVCLRSSPSKPDPKRLYPVCVSTGETDMSDLIFLALGAGTLLVLAVYARALERL